MAHIYIVGYPRGFAVKDSFQVVHVHVVCERDYQDLKYAGGRGFKPRPDQHSGSLTL